MKFISIFTSDFCYFRLLYINGWILLALQQNICLCIYVLWSRGEGEGGGSGGEWEGEIRKKTSLQKKWGFTALKPLAVSLPLWYPPFSFLSFTPILISLHPPVILHIPWLFAVFSPASQSQQRGPEMKPLSWIIYPQSKSLKRGLCHCACFNREEVLLCKPHPTRL